MVEVVKKTLAGQFGGALQMLDDCIDKCEPGHWRSPVGKAEYWRVAYHTLYFTDLYLSTAIVNFHPADFHQEDAQFFERMHWWPTGKEIAKIEKPFDKQMLAGYLKVCMKRAKESIERETEETFAGPSGFDWLQIPRLEAHLYNLRHLQHHTGQLSAALARWQGKGAKWVREASLG